MNDNPLGYQDIGGFQGQAGFSEARSFQMFVESLRELQSYEVDPAPAKLDTAATTLQRCVDTYPADALPRFYLGMARTLQGDEKVDQAIQLFTEIVESGPPSLRRPAQYNLAAAHVEKYKLSNFQKAETLLKDLASDIGRIDPHHENPSLSALLGQSCVLWAYCVADGRVWRPAEVGNQEAVEAARREEGAAAEVVRLLEQAEDAANRPGVPAAVRIEVQADSWNVKGYLAESKAFGKDHLSRQYAEQAVEDYEKALALRKNWIPAQSNLARVYQRMLDDPESARKLWDKVLAVRPDDGYANYMLGRMVEPKDLKIGPRDALIEAYRHYRKAATIPEAVERAEAIMSQLDWWELP